MGGGLAAFFFSGPRGPAASSGGAGRWPSLTAHPRPCIQSPAPASTEPLIPPQVAPHQAWPCAAPRGLSAATAPSFSAARDRLPEALLAAAVFVRTQVGTLSRPGHPDPAPRGGWDGKRRKHGGTDRGGGARRGGGVEHPVSAAPASPAQPHRPPRPSSSREHCSGAALRARLPRSRSRRASADRGCMRRGGN